MSARRYRTTSMRFVMLIVLFVGLCMPICDLADHHASSVPHGILCVFDMPQVFHLFVVMSSLFFAPLAAIVVRPVLAFALLKPPRFVPSN